MPDTTRRFLESIQSPYFVVALLLGLSLSVMPVMEPLIGDWGDLLPSAALSFAFALGTFSATRRAWVQRSAVGAGVLCVAFTALNNSTGVGTWDVLGRVCFAFASMVALVAILGFVLRARTVEAEEIFAAVSVYMLLGFFWSYLYIFIELMEPGVESFTGLEGSTPDDAASKLVYFSFVTLTTLGYGDIVPLSDYARSLAVFEAITGQLFIAVLLARLVAMQIMNAAPPAPPRQPPGPPPGAP